MCGECGQGRAGIARRYGATRLKEEAATAGRPLRIPGPVLTEVCYLIEREQDPHTEAGFLTSLADGEFELLHPTTSDLRRMAEW